MSDTAARMAAYAEHLETYGGVRIEHAPGTNTLGKCIPADHCHIHHVDEPDNGDVYRSCLECGHIFVTEMDLQAADVAIRTKIWQADLRSQPRPLDHSGAPVAQPGVDIVTCPLCTHDFGPQGTR